MHLQDRVWPFCLRPCLTWCAEQVEFVTPSLSLPLCHCFLYFAGTGTFYFLLGHYTDEFIKVDAGKQEIEWKKYLNLALAFLLTVYSALE